MAKGTESVVEVSRDDAVALLVAVGWKPAPKWDNAKLASRLSKVPEALTSDTEIPAELKDTLELVKANCEEGGKFEVTGDEPEGAQGEKKAPRTLTPEEREAKKKEMAAARQKRLEDMAKKRAAKKLNRKTWASSAGRILAREGLTSLITDEFVLTVCEEMDKFEEGNIRDAKVISGQIQKGIRAYLDELEVLKGGN